MGCHEYELLASGHRFPSVHPGAKQRAQPGFERLGHDIIVVFPGETPGDDLETLERLGGQLLLKEPEIGCHGVGVIFAGAKKQFARQVGLLRAEGRNLAKDRPVGPPDRRGAGKVVREERLRLEERVQHQQ